MISAVTPATAAFFALLASLIGGAIVGGLTLWANQRLFGWRIREIEERLEPFDRTNDSVIIRLARIEARRSPRRA
jgi:hypothetical protein